MKQILKDCIDIITGEGWKLPKGIKVKTANDYFKDKPFSPSYVDRDTNTVYIMSTIIDKDIIKRLIMHELIHLIDTDNYGHGGEFKKRTELLNKRYNLNLPYAAEDMLDGTEIFKKNPELKKQAYQIFAKNSGRDINTLTDKIVYKKTANSLQENYFPY